MVDAGVDYIHVTEFEAWKPAFGVEGPTLVQQARRFAKDTTIIANGGLHDAARTLEALKHGAGIIALGRGALSNPDWPAKVQMGRALQDFDRSIFGPIVDIKDVRAGSSNNDQLSHAKLHIECAALRCFCISFCLNAAQDILGGLFDMGFAQPCCRIGITLLNCSNDGIQFLQRLRQAPGLRHRDTS